MAAEPIPQVNPSAPDKAQSAPAGPKFILRSKTFLSALILALPQILGAFGIEFSDASAQQWLQIVTTVLGFIGIVYGRVKADGPVHFGGEKFQRAVDAFFFIGVFIVAALALGGCANGKLTLPGVKICAKGSAGGADGTACYDGKTNTAVFTVEKIAK